MTTWLTDKNGNKCSVEYFGSKETAQRALDSLKNCKNCVNCSNCSDCKYCSRCWGCSDCSDCRDRRHKRFNAASDVSVVIPAIPQIENIHQKVYKAASAEGALNMRSWHKDGFCGTTHCRAGWVTHLAGEAGRALEVYWGGANHAAWLIYKASDPNIKGRPNFFASKEEALADMKRLADLEKEAAR